MPFGGFTDLRFYEQAFVNSTKECIAQVEDARHIFQCVAWPIAAVCLCLILTLLLLVGMVFAIKFGVEDYHAKKFKRELQAQNAAAPLPPSDGFAVLTVDGPTGRGGEEEKED
ncbi:protein ORF108 [Cyprinid herpesvirus 1]|uniref:Protein ORF108 n=1 Tax=Cyprinid herpesvirus 1 TaxID=317858 RepID=K7PBD8_9VIRU|nr:protein ORF108 [Cyprinid herpesvirus 1]AFJ20404.1 protein ORF108 [Cyprinid herpesvirus 1]